MYVHTLTYVMQHVWEPQDFCCSKHKWVFIDLFRWQQPSFEFWLKRGKTAREVQREAVQGGGDRGEAAYSPAVKLSNRICRESESETSELNPHSSLTDNKYWKEHA